MLYPSRLQGYLHYQSEYGQITQNDLHPTSVPFDSLNTGGIYFMTFVLPHFPPIAG